MDSPIDPRDMPVPERLLRGQGRFIEDEAAPGQLAMAILRAPVAHGRIATVAEVEAAVREAARALAAAGWEVVETDTPPVRECAHLNSLLWMEETRRHDHEMIVAEDDPDANMVYEQWSAMAGESTLNALRDALKLRSTHLRAWQGLLDDERGVVCPVSAELPFRDHRDGESAEEFAKCYEANLLQCGLPFMGLPGLTVTTGLVGATPVGVQLVANRCREDVLLDAGAAIEAAGGAPAPVDPA